MTVTLFRKIADDFKEAAREQSFMVKEFEFNLKAREAEAKQMSELQGDLRKKHVRLLLEWFGLRVNIRQKDGGHRCTADPSPKHIRRGALFVCVFGCVCVCVRVRACVRVCVYVCVCV